ncbi:MATE family efflux transporter [Anaerostipes sp. MSJ-23]|uniref:MATE family efflux transporter n=1 Tax=Anaerostipes sp. MSJ-23 TaxID=2841520 RepID=UPI001C116517|nr:MATE family efflux transporter [Anaerostipes sp. MSJ-23]MBU5460252.1 MATE family efflux transporter [Anaerostipes sp. MSJ-23]
MDQIYMKEKPVFPLLMSMALPMILSMFVNSLYNIVDSIFVAKISEDAMTALSLVYPLQNLITSIGVGFGVGVNAVIAIFLGAQNKEKANKAATQGLFLNIIHGIILMILGLLFMPSFLRIFTQNEALIHLGLKYSNIVLIFSVVVTSEITFEKIFQSVGKMMVTMASLLCGCMINIILDPILIFGFGPFPVLGIEGAAVATVIGQCSTLIIYLIIYVKYPLNVQLSRKYLKPEKDLWIRLYSVGIPATLNMALPSVLVSALNGILASFSQTYIVVLGIYYKLQTFLYMTANGLVQGMRPLISYNYGAREYKRVGKIYRTSLFIILGIMAIGTILCMGIPQSLMNMFTKNPKTVQLGIEALRFISIGFLASAVSVTSAGAFEALSEGGPSFIVSLLRYVVVILPAAYILSRIMGAIGVWNAFWVAEIITAIVSIFLYRNIIGRKEKL